MLACFARGFVVKLIKTFGKICSVSTNDGLLLSAVQVEFESGKRSDIVSLCYISAGVCLNATENNIGICVLTRKTFKNWLEIHAGTAPGSPEINDYATAIFDDFGEVSLVLDFENFAKLWHTWSSSHSGAAHSGVTHAGVTHASVAHASVTAVSRLATSPTHLRRKSLHHLIHITSSHSRGHHASKTRRHTHRLLGLGAFLVVPWLPDVQGHLT